MVLEMLNIIEAWPLHTGEIQRADSIHYQLAKKLAFEDRIRHLEDPEFGDPKIAMLIRRTMRRSDDSYLPTPFGDRRRCRSVGRGYHLSLRRRSRGQRDFLDQSIFASFGSRVIAGDTGVIMNNRLCSFGLDPSKANSLKPRKRPAHTLNTYMVFKGGEFFAVGGTPGADEQPQTNLRGSA